MSEEIKWSEYLGDDAGIEEYYSPYMDDEQRAEIVRGMVRIWIRSGEIHPEEEDARVAAVLRDMDRDHEKYLTVMHID